MSPECQRRRPRQADIARVAGVSQTVVSWVVNDRAGAGTKVAPETRQRVLDAITELGYVADPAAQSLRGGRTGILGLYTFESVFPVDHRDFYYPFLLGIEAEVETQGYDLLLFTSAAGGDGERGIFRGGVNRLRRTDGCVLLGKEGSKEDLGRLARDGFPFVFVGRRDVPDVAISFAAADYAAGAAEVVGHLASLGHHRIAYVSYRSRIESVEDREAGFRRAVRDLGLDGDPDLVIHADPEGIAAKQLSQVFATEATAIVVHDMRLAEPVLRQAAGRRLRVPDDVSVAVLEDPPPPAEIEIALTGVSIPRREMGATAIRLLIDQLDADAPSVPKQVVLPCSLVVGGSTAPPRRP